MTSRTPIVDLWAAGRVPIEDGVFFADGRSYAVEVVDGRLDAVAELDLAAMLADDPDWLAAIDVTGEQEIPDGAGHVCVGEGSHGSEGFFARLDAARRLVWVCHLSGSNPFAGLEVAAGTATVTSTSGLRVTVDLDSPVTGQR
jgi:hypothetical protein